VNSSIKLARLKVPRELLCLAALLALALVSHGVLKPDVVRAWCFECSNSIDDDGDGLLDQGDPGYWSDPHDPGSYDPSG